MNHPSQFPPLTAAHVGSRRLRTTAIRADNLRRTEQATRIARVANDRWSGPPRQYRIEPRIGFDPPIPLWFRIYIAVALVVATALVVVR